MRPRVVGDRSAVCIVYTVVNTVSLTCDGCKKFDFSVNFAVFFSSNSDSKYYSSAVSTGLCDLQPKITISGAELYVSLISATQPNPQPKLKRPTQFPLPGKLLDPRPNPTRKCKTPSKTQTNKQTDVSLSCGDTL